MQYCAISSTFSVIHSDSASRATLRPNLIVSKKINLPRNVTCILTSDECSPKTKQNKTKQTHSETVYCRFTFFLLKLHFTMGFRTFYEYCRYWDYLEN